MLDLAPHSRLWIYQADRFLTKDEVDYINNEMSTFIASWAAHGNELFGGVELAYDLFLIVAVDEKRAPASGCSIDSLVRKIQAIGEKLKVDFFNRLKVAYEDESTKIHLVTLEEFKHLISKDEVTSQTTVYNNLVTNLEEFNQKWRTKMENSWHKDLVQII